MDSASSASARRPSAALREATQSEGTQIPNSRILASWAVASTHESVAMPAITSLATSSCASRTGNAVPRKAECLGLRM